jgi:hypothetical protein
MPEQHLHIVSFDIPYPANYGGVIDVFYKIKALHSAGFKLHLHCFQYNREPAPDLKKYCTSVDYYPRMTSLLSLLTIKPYIVYSRRSGKLLENLLKDKYPILFEGLHSCYYLDHPKLRGRIKIYRESNIEHQYYFQLSKAEKNIFIKFFFFSASLKLRLFQNVLSKASLILTVSKEDNNYLAARFPGVRVEYLPSFHHDNEVTIMPGKGNFILYQGNLGVPENFRAAEFLIREVFGGVNRQLVIAGLNPPDHLVRLANSRPNITLIANSTDERMAELIRTAQINLLVTFQATGLKLKLLNALFNGRFCLVNPGMITGTELGPLCEIGNDAKELRKKIDELMDLSFDEQWITRRREILMKWHSNTENCKKLRDLLLQFLQ